MMEDLAMHMMEIIMNSVKANSSLIKIFISSLSKTNETIIEIIDDGCGMDKEMLEKVTDPFTTSRTTRKVGLGVSFMKGLCESCDGTFIMKSEVGKGTYLKDTIRKDHIDAPPLGDIGELIMISIQSNENIDYELVYIDDYNEFAFKSKTIKEELSGISLLEPEILLWIKEYINQEIRKERS